ncbi:MAG: hypothetical protein OXE84_00165 [Rhodobacteraceae bacterium]|nr:hypothetical protein [Paracoccaceae bacterium]MCY4196317.1 hypothetical protein [Paracoccaceae bacterium]MCY4328383.1 hypothetical protein [Paracoccaceae bacterium]
MTVRTVALLATVLLAVLPARAAPASDSDTRLIQILGAVGAVNNRDRFDLWTECRKVRLGVDLDGGEAIGLTAEQIERKVRFQLLLAQMYTDAEVDQELLIHVWVDAGAVFLAIDFHRKLSAVFAEDYALGPGSASTWYLPYFDARVDNADAILSRITTFTNLFIDDYRRVNAPACDGDNPS